MFGTSSIPKRLKYEPALDGLRALAIVLVLLHHDNVGRNTLHVIIPGGFLGVDVFFVLSGFLITSILLIGRNNSGKPLSVDFWIRRARRLLPALVVALLLTAAYAALFAKPGEMVALRSQGLATLFYVQNWWLIIRQGGLTPLSHTFSLAIEEQWYIVWPFLLAGLLFLTRGSRRWLLTGIALLAGASYVEMVLMFSRANWGRIYDGTDTRVWELLAGAALAVLMLGREPIRNRAGRVLLEISGIAGLAYLIWAVENLRSEGLDAWQYTRGGLLLVVISVACMIAAMVHPRSPVLRPVLGWRPFVALGLISYGVYLYHLGVFMVLSENRTGLTGYSLTALRWSVTLAIATLSYFLVEQPIRRGLHWTPPRIALATTAVAAVVALLLAATVSTPQRPPSLAEQATSFRRLSRSTPSGEPRVLIAGSAFAFSMGWLAKPPVDVGGIRGATVANYGCGIAVGPIVVGSAKTKGFCPYDWPSLYANAVESFRPDVAVLMLGPDDGLDREVNGRVLRGQTAALASYLNGQLDRARLVLTARGATMMLATVPCVYPGAKAPRALSVLEGGGPRNAWMNQLWRAYAAKHPDVRLLDLSSVLCRNGDPRGMVHGVPLRPDGAALSAEGVAYIWHWLAPQAIAVSRTDGARAAFPRADQSAAPLGATPGQ